VYARAGVLDRFLRCDQILKGGLLVTVPNHVLNHVSTLPTLKREQVVHCLAKADHPRAPVARRRRTVWVPGVDSWIEPCPRQESLPGSWLTARFTVIGGS
jgi:hypothetical protein